MRSPPYRRAGIALVALCVVGCVDDGATDRPRATVQRDEARPESKPDEPGCAPGECAPPPRGIKGLAFGMSVAEVRGTLPAKSRLKRLRSEVRRPSEKSVSNVDGLDVSGAARAAQRQSPATRYRWRTKVGDLKAACWLFFLNDELGAIRCELERSRNAKVHAARVASLRTSLEGQYGLRHAERHQGRAWTAYVWRDDEVTLVLEVTHRDRRSGPFEITLENRTRAYADALREVDVEAQREFEAALEAQREALRSKAARRAAAKAARDKALRRDLSPAAESGR